MLLNAYRALKAWIASHPPPTCQKSDASARGLVASSAPFQSSSIGTKKIDTSVHAFLQLGNTRYFNIRAVCTVSLSDIATPWIVLRYMFNTCVKVSYVLKLKKKHSEYILDTF